MIQKSEEKQASLADSPLEEMRTNPALLWYVIKKLKKPREQGVENIDDSGKLLMMQYFVQRFNLAEVMHENYTEEAKREKIKKFGEFASKYINSERKNLFEDIYQLTKNAEDEDELYLPLGDKLNEIFRDIQTAFNSYGDKEIREIIKVTGGKVQDKGAGAELFHKTKLPVQ